MQPSITPNQSETQKRREAIRKYKELKPQQGAFAVRATVSGGVWVGSSRNLNAARNHVFFTLRLGSHLNRSLQKQWTEDGGDGYKFEILELLKEDVPAISLADLLAQKKRDWIAKLGAEPL